MSMWYGGFRPYVSVGERRRKAKEYTKKLQTKGRKISPVEIAGKKIATSFWGKAWCSHLESFSDYANRLPRGRTYVRNGSVVDLQITPGKVQAMVSGSEIYEVEIEFAPLAKQRWHAIKQQCGGQIASVVELLQGKLSDAVMNILTHRDRGLFPDHGEIELSCSCPDDAYMCKHVAAVLYGVGSRLDLEPELFFTLRQVDQAELIEAVGLQIVTAPAGDAASAIAEENLADVFGIDVESNLPVSAAALAAIPSLARGARAAKGTAVVKSAKSAKAAKPKVAGRPMSKTVKLGKTVKTVKPVKPVKSPKAVKTGKFKPVATVASAAAGARSARVASTQSGKRRQARPHSQPT